MGGGREAGAKRPLGEWSMLHQRMIGHVLGSALLGLRRRGQGVLAIDVDQLIGDGEAHQVRTTSSLG